MPWKGCTWTTSTIWTSSSGRSQSWWVEPRYVFGWVHQIQYITYINNFFLCPHRKSCRATRTLCGIWTQPPMPWETVYGRFWFWWSIARVMQLWCKQNYGLNIMQSKVCPCVIFKFPEIQVHTFASQFIPLTVVRLSL